MIQNLIDGISAGLFLLMLLWASARSSSSSAEAPEAEGGTPSDGLLPPPGRPPVFLVHLGPAEVLAIEEDAIEQARRRAPIAGHVESE